MLQRLSSGDHSVTHVRQVRYGTQVVDQYALHNGLTVLHLPDTRAPLFSYQTWFRVGSRHEQPGKTGIAHLFEHLMFKGTTDHPEGEFDRTIEGLGGRINAATWLDWTFYYESIPDPKNMPLVVELEADRLENMLLISEQLESERKVVINERKEVIDNDPSGTLDERLWATAYTEHPYGHPTIGWMVDIEGLSLEDCKAFHKTWYAPNNATVVVVGDVEAEPLLREIMARYGHLEAQAIPAIAPIVEPMQTEARRVEVPLQLTADRLVMGYHSPAADDAGHAALQVLSEALFEGDSARLRRSLVTDGEIASSFSAYLPALRDPGLYEISVDLRPGHTAEEAEAVLLAELAKVAETGLSDAELSKAINKLETGFYQGLQTAQQRAHGLGYWAITVDDFSRAFTVADRYRAVTHAEIIAVAREVLRPTNRTVVIGRPIAQ
jgi:zinc protease